MEIHEAANLMPEMSDEEFEAFKASMRDAGECVEPIELYKGKLIDGRHRLRAARELGFEDPDAMDVDEVVAAHYGDDPYEYVYARNFHRRHLNASQKAIVAAKRMSRKESATLRSGKASVNAGNAAGVSGRIVEQAKNVVEKGSVELQKAVEAGAVSVARAEKVVDRPKREQMEALKAPAKPETSQDADELEDWQRWADTHKWALAQLTQMVKKFEADKKGGAVYWSDNWGRLIQEIKDLRATIRMAEPVGGRVDGPPITRAEEERAG